MLGVAIHCIRTSWIRCYEQIPILTRMGFPAVLVRNLLNVPYVLTLTVGGTNTHHRPDKA